MMDPKQVDQEPNKDGSTGMDFLKMVVLTVVCIVGAVLLIQLLQAVM